ncbi:glycosyltransferase [Candidatus Dojkabacteria bacterium]|nr:glycosyltransferase [Candidatus Dojkabacteria bacterium]
MASNKQPKVSIIIPALNEEQYLPQLLEGIKKQTYPKIETIVAISPKTTDGTKKIAQDYHVKITKGGLYSEAKNNGAKIATGDILFFFDADVKIPTHTIALAIDLIEKEDAGYGFIGYKFTIDKKEYDEVMKLISDIKYLLVNSTTSVVLSFLASARAVVGASTFIRKDLFEKIGGFNEEIKYMAEDVDLGKRAAKYGKYLYIPIKINTSSRRIESMGLLKYVYTMILGLLMDSINRKAKIQFYKPRVNGDSSYNNKDFLSYIEKKN